MDKAFIVYVAIGLAFFYAVTHYVGVLQKDDGLQTEEYRMQHAYDAYYTKDPVLGEKIMDVSQADASTQKEVWNHSPLRSDMLVYFPQFDAMKSYVKMHVKGEPLHSDLIRRIDEVYNAYIIGDIDAEKAKARLMKL